MRFLAVFALPLPLAACKSETQVVDGAMAINICRATIAALMLHPVQIIRFQGSDGKAIYVSYRRPDDGKIWKNKCKFDGERVIYAPQGGRWHDIIGQDAYVTFELLPAQKTLRIRQHIAASSIVNDYPFDQLNEKPL